VVLQEEPVHGQLREQCLGDEVVPAGGDPGGAEVAAAHVRGDGHVRGLAGDRVVDLLDVPQVHVLGVLAASGDLGALGRVVQVGQRGVVELQVGAAQLVQPLDLVGVGGGQVRPELLHFRVHRLVDRGGAAAVVHHVRRGDGQLGYGRGDVGPQERERVREDRVVDLELAVDADRGGGELDVP